MNLNLVKQRFKKGFKTYDKYAFIQEKIAKLLIKYLKTIKKNFDSIVEIGSGTGILSKLIEKNLKFNTIIFNDLVEESFFYLQKKLKIPFTFLAGNGENLKVKSELLISASTFQWFKNLKKALKNYNCKYLAFSLFLKPTLPEISKLFDVSLNYYSFEEVKEILRSLNYKIIYAFYGQEILSFSNLFEALRYLKYTGVNSLSKNIISLNILKEKDKIFRLKYGKLTFSYGIFIAKRKR